MSRCFQDIPHGPSLVSAGHGTGSYEFGGYQIFHPDERNRDVHRTDPEDCRHELRRLRAQRERRAVGAARRQSAPRSRWSAARRMCASTPRRSRRSGCWPRSTTPASRRPSEAVAERCGVARGVAGHDRKPHAQPHPESAFRDQRLSRARPDRLRARRAWRHPGDDRRPAGEPVLRSGPVSGPLRDAYDYLRALDAITATVAEGHHILQSRWR